MPGNSIASALANEFNEAVGELYTSSLIELGLILFFITFVVLSLARFMLLQAGATRRTGSMTCRTYYRPVDIMLNFTHAAASSTQWDSVSVLTMLFGLFWLGWILITLLDNGLPGLSSMVFTQITPPPGSEAA